MFQIKHEIIILQNSLHYKISKLLDSIEKCKYIFIEKSKVSTKRKKIPN